MKLKFGDKVRVIVFKNKKKVLYWKGVVLDFFINEDTKKPEITVAYYTKNPNQHWEIAYPDISEIIEGW